MEIYYSELNNDIGMIKLNGKMDIVGTNEIEAKFAFYCAGDKIRMIVDVSEVNFLSSIGIRLFVRTAKSVAKRGGKMALLNPISEVHHILELTGVPSIIPIYSQFESAETVLLAPRPA
jgi:anti-anti-sigma factor